MDGICGIIALIRNLQMSNGFVMMTALVPTVGHKFLVDSALNFLESEDPSSKLYVMICGRSFEPTLLSDRVNSFKEEFVNRNIEVVGFLSDDAPQSPKTENDVEFWNWWKDSVNKTFNAINFDYVFASEKYGIKLAEVLHSKFIPIDIDRTTFNISGTELRENLDYLFNEYTMDSFKKYITRVVTIFGAESIGKTTTAKYLARNLNSVYVHEWARPYLETVGSELSYSKMMDIVHGQYAAQKAAKNTNNKNSIIIQDTDLLSTIGYFRIIGYDVPKVLIDRFKETQSDLYIVLKSNIPFEPDPLRYGGDKRESSDEFWVNLLIEFDCNFIEVTFSDIRDRNYYISSILSDMYCYNPIKTFKRD
jgi:HTH-type transcriptional regulator, transcriptional repressor of NAD biosynthesis genes